MSIDLSVVVAVYNEHPDNLVRLLERLYTVLSPTGVSYEVVFVNDGSKEPTTRALAQLAREVANVKLVELSRNFGQQAAISAGLDHTDGRAIVNIDSDLQDPPELIPEMLKRWREGYDVVYAQRSTRRDRLFKRLSAHIFYRLLGAVSSVQIPWDTGDFRLMDRRVIEALNNCPEKTRFLRGQIPWLGFKQIGIPIDRGAREVGESTYTLKKLLLLAMDGLLAFSSAPLYGIAGLGAILAALSLVGFIACMFVPGALQANVVLLISVGALLAGLQIICLGVVAVYVAKVLDEVRARPTYIVGELYRDGEQQTAQDRSLPAYYGGVAEDEVTDFAPPEKRNTAAPETVKAAAETAAESAATESAPTSDAVKEAKAETVSFEPAAANTEPASESGKTETGEVTSPTSETVASK